MVFFYGLFSALTYGTADFLGGVSSRKNSAIVVVAWSQAMGLLTALVAVFLLGTISVSPGDILWGMAAGIAGASGVGLLYRGIASGFASIVSPLAALVGAVLPVFFGLIIGERPDLMTWIGISAAFPAIFFLSWEKGEKNPHIAKSLRIGFLAGIAFSAFFILIAQTSENSGMVPLLSARTMTVPIFFIAALIRREKLVPKPGTVGVTFLSGFLDMLANIFYLLAARSGFLIIAVILTSLYPAPTVFLQSFYFHEKLTALRLVGIALSITGATLIGIGG
jgi:drug/metabolite transporter (DMT)-like permease